MFANISLFGSFGPRSVALVKPCLELSEHHSAVHVGLVLHVDRFEPCFVVPVVPLAPCTAVHVPHFGVLEPRSALHMVACV